MKSKRKLKKKFVVFLSLYALFFVSYFTLTTLARYATSLNKQGNISIAKWDVSVAGEDTTTLPTMIIGNSNTYQSYNLSVTSKSETAVNYSAIITNVPTGVKIQVDDKELYSENNHVIDIPDLGIFAAGDENHTHIHKLTIIVESGADIINKTLDLDVIFNQVNSQQIN